MAVRRGNMYLLLLVCVLFGGTHQAPVSDAGATDNNLPTGEFLSELGTNFSSPLLRLLGKVFINYEGSIDDVVEERLSEKLCQLHPCTDWASWSKCPAVRVGQFSMASRTRNCSVHSSLCPHKATGNEAVTKTMESKVCEGVCPTSYNYTDGFCLQPFTEPIPQYDAQSACEQDGGHLVNINTEAKSDAVHAVLASRGITSHAIWINGNRTQGNGEWQYTYGAEPDFDNWYSNEPDNGPTDLCKVDSSGKRQWFDVRCSDKRYYFCEIV